VICEGREWMEGRDLLCGEAGQRRDLAVLAAQVADLAGLWSRCVAGWVLTTDEGVQMSEGLGAVTRGGNRLVVDVVDCNRSVRGSTSYESEGEAEPALTEWTGSWRNAIDINGEAYAFSGSLRGSLENHALVATSASAWNGSKILRVTRVCRDFWGVTLLSCNLSKRDVGDSADNGEGGGKSECAHLGFVC